MYTPTALHRFRYPLAVAMCVAIMLVALPFREGVDVANIDMLFLLAVFISAIWLGRGPAVMSAFLGVALFDFFFVPPYLSFAVADAQYLITFAVMLSVGLITSHLVSRLAERTEQAQESELRASEERLRTSILASLSHDLRTPLTSLVGLADALAQQQSPSAAVVTETASIIRDQAQAMHHMLSNLLEMARLKSNDVRLNKEWQPIDEIIGSSLRLLAGPLSERALDIRIQPGLPLVSFDAVLMERVVFNLLDNAIKYSAPGSTVQLKVSSQSGQLVVEIINEGKGFASESIDSVFDLFVRGDPEAASTGTGIGLAICKAIVTAHDGQITAENLPGGACVRFSLPLGTPPSFAEESEV